MSDNRQFYAAVNRMIRAAYKRVAESDPEDFFSLGDLAAQCRHYETLAVKALRAKGYTWEHIGSGFCLSRQAAFKRWGRENDTCN